MSNGRYYLWTVGCQMNKADSEKLSAGLQRLGWHAVGIVFLQIVSGGLVAGTSAGLLLNTWPRMGT